MSLTLDHWYLAVGLALTLSLIWMLSALLGLCMLGFGPGEPSATRREKVLGWRLGRLQTTHEHQRAKLDTWSSAVAEHGADVRVARRAHNRVFGFVLLSAMLVYVMGVMQAALALHLAQKGVSGLLVPSLMGASAAFALFFGSLWFVVQWWPTRARGIWSVVEQGRVLSDNSGKFSTSASQRIRALNNVKTAVFESMVADNSIWSQIDLRTWRAGEAAGWVMLTPASHERDSDQDALWLSAAIDLIAQRPLRRPPWAKAARRAPSSLREMLLGLSPAKLRAERKAASLAYMALGSLGVFVVLLVASASTQHPIPEGDYEWLVDLLEGPGAVIASILASSIVLVGSLFRYGLKRSPVPPPSAA